MNVKEVKIKKTMVHSEGGKLIPLVQELRPGEKLEIPILIGKNDRDKIEFYSEEKKPEKAIGFLDKGQEDVEDLVEDIIDGRTTYKCYLTGVEGSVFTGKIKYENVEAEVPKVDSQEFEDIIAEIVAKGICEEDRVRKNIEIMKSHRCPDEMIRQILLTYRKYDKAVKVPKTTYVDADPKNPDQSIFSQCLLNTLIKSPTIYEGDKSVGKNVCAETVALVRNQPYYIISFNRNMIGDDIYGTKTTDNTAASKLSLENAGAYLKVMADGWDNVSEDVREKAAQFELHKAQSASVAIIQELSQYVEWVKNGGVMTFNEMNMAEANFFSSITNQLTDGTGFVDVPGYGRIDINPDCILIGTQNAEYTGVCEQNDATLSRFACIQFPYPPSVKTQLKAAVKATLHHQYFTQVDELYKALHAAVLKNRVSNSCLNIRGFVRALEAVALIPKATSLLKQVQIQVINTCPADDRAVLLALAQEKITL